jgi:hypothetical protein
MNKTPPNEQMCALIKGKRQKRNEQMWALIKGTSHTQNEQMSKLINGMRQMERTKKIVTK